MTIWDILEMRSSAWLSEYPAAHAALGNFMGKDRYEVALLTDQDAKNMRHLFGEEADQGILLINTNPYKTMISCSGRLKIIGRRQRPPQINRRK